MPVTAVVLLLLLAGGSAQQPSAGQPPSQGADGTTAQTSSTRPAVNPDALPVSIDRIQKGLERKPLVVWREATFDSDNGLPTFRIGIEGQKLTIDQILGPDYLRGPVPAGAMTHQEFLNMVTPTDVQGYAMFDNKQAVTVALTSFAMQWALKTALKAFHDARDERARAAARKEVEEALEALRQARRDAGLPDK